MILDGVRAELGPTSISRRTSRPATIPGTSGFASLPNGDFFASIREGRTSDRDGRDRDLHGDRHQAALGQGARCRSGGDGHGPQPAGAGRRRDRGRRPSRRSRNHDDLQGRALQRPPEPGVRVRLHQRLVDAQGRPPLRLRVPPAQLHGEARLRASARRATPIRPWSVCRSSISPRAISSGRWTSCRDKDRAGLGRSIRTTCATSSPCSSRPSTTACWNSRRVPRSQRGLRRRRLPGLCKAQERPDGGAQSTHTLSGIPPLGWSVTRAIGVGSWPATGSKLADCSRVASMAVASIIANAMPMQMRGPAPNGRYW